MNERERELEPTAEVTVTFRRSTLDKVNEAAAMLGLTPAQYIGIASVTAAREDIGRKNLLRMAGAEKGGGR